MDSRPLTQILLPLASSAGAAQDLRIRKPGLASELLSDELFHTDPFSSMNPGSPQEEGLPRPDATGPDSPHPALDRAPLINAPSAAIVPHSPPDRPPQESQ